MAAPSRYPCCSASQKETNSDDPRNGGQQFIEGQTALHFAAEHGHVDCARVLLERANQDYHDIEAREDAHGRTPLLVACVIGHMDVVKLLLDAGADAKKIGNAGWSAKELAVLHGHFGIAELLPTLPLRGSDLKMSSKKPDNMLATIFDTSNTTYLTNESVVLLTLGSLDRFKDVIPVELDHSEIPHQTLSLAVSTLGASGPHKVVKLPLAACVSNTPIILKTEDIAKMKVIFDIQLEHSNEAVQIVARGVALLSNIISDADSQLSKLDGDTSVPILAPDTLALVGRVNINCRVIRPFPHPGMESTVPSDIFEDGTRSMLIGHRGMGKNTSSHKNLQLGENTIQSFLTAASLGAEFVEFDVQLTKDRVPVIYHDFMVSETGTDAPMYSLSLEQFLHLNKSPDTSRNEKLGDITANDQATAYPFRARSASLGAENHLNFPDMADRMQQTLHMKHNGFKSNSRGRHIQTPFTTLFEMFQKLPSNLGFNIEMKYPALHEAQMLNMDPYAIELNTFIDSVLDIVYSNVGARKIVFSSFHPDLCILLKLKQPRYPVLFLTDAGTWPAGDIRSTSLQCAIDFAEQWDLRGIVSNATPFMVCPRLIRKVKRSGLACLTYGVQNNEPANVRVQVDEGIDAVIVDSVLKIRKALDEMI